jgi:hypothetical protein
VTKLRIIVKRFKPFILLLLLLPPVHNLIQDNPNNMSSIGDRLGRRVWEDEVRLRRNQVFWNLVVPSMTICFDGIGFD